MSSVGATDSGGVRPSVFLSYASEDRQAARTIGDALPAYGLEVWYDESELGGGDLWDQKIRRQIRECDYFMALISAQTEARHEGYFRREWRLAVERTLDMADDHPFLLPIAIDDTDQATARVPEKFLATQWLRVPGGRPTPAFEALCRRIASGEAVAVQPARKAPARPAGSRAPASAPAPIERAPEFPKEEPGQRTRFWFAVIGWLFKSAWALFKRWPRWVRLTVYIWLAIVLMSRGCSSTPRHHDARETSPTPRETPSTPRETLPTSQEISPESIAKLKEIADQYKGSWNAADIAKLSEQIAREYSGGAPDSAGGHSSMLVIPFTAPAGDAASEKFADSTFAMVYGMAAASHHGLVGMAKEPLPSQDLAAALERGRAHHSTYILYGTVATQGSEQALTIKIASVEDGKVVWSKSYPAKGADSAKIAAEVDSKIPDLDED
jgi:TolB-like protein